jgi:hypothetical protein
MTEKQRDTSTTLDELLRRGRQRTARQPLLRTTTETLAERGRVLLRTHVNRETFDALANRRRSFEAVALDLARGAVSVLDEVLATEARTLRQERQGSATLREDLLRQLKEERLRPTPAPVADEAAEADRADPSPALERLARLDEARVRQRFQHLAVTGIGTALRDGLGRASQALEARLAAAGVAVPPTPHRPADPQERKLVNRLVDTQGNTVGYETAGGERKSLERIGIEIEAGALPGYHMVDVRGTRFPRSDPDFLTRDTTDNLETLPVVELDAAEVAELVR